MRSLADQLRIGNEKIYGVITLLAGGALWLLIVWGLRAGLASTDPTTRITTLAYVSYAIAIALFVFISRVLYRASAFGNMILLGPHQFPELYAMVVAGASDLGMREPPKTFLYNSNGLFNAFARRMFGGQYVFLTSALVEATDNEQVRFVIGHELGHHAAGHLNPWKGLLRLPSHFVPFLHPAYSRAREFTCDRIGAHLSRNVEASTTSLQMLGCGCRRLNGAMNQAAFLEQEAMVPAISGFFNEIIRSHPRLTRRVTAIRREFSQQAAASGLAEAARPIQQLHSSALESGFSGSH
jgi:Zn-dependent protease with chaperone function